MTDYNGIRSRAAIDLIAQVPQRQDGLEDQLRDVIVAANKLGCYDAADWIKSAPRDLNGVEIYAVVYTLGDQEGVHSVFAAEADAEAFIRERSGVAGRYHVEPMTVR